MALILSALAKDEAAGGQVEEHQTAWQSLGRKEIVEMRNDLSFRGRIVPFVDVEE